MAQFTPPLTDAEAATAFPGQFASVRIIAAGGQGAVFRAERHDGTVSALKIYVPDPGAEIERRTDREVQALRRLARPTIVALDDNGVVTIRGQQCQFVSTTFIEGVPLSAHLSQTQPLSTRAVALVGHDIADAIEALWAAPDRIVHRDVKPQNVMLSASGRAVLIDLGLARHIGLESLTVTGNTWGTRGYMSPEQAAARKALTCKSDVFALGIMMQQCLAGRHPTNGNQPALASGGPPTASLVPGIPGEVKQLIDLMVHRNPHHRPMPGQIKASLLSHAGGPGRPW